MEGEEEGLFLVGEIDLFLGEAFCVEGLFFGEGNDVNGCYVERVEDGEGCVELGFSAV